MPNGINFVGDLSRYIGQTVTIFTTSGGQSGSGFTGVLAFVNPSYVRLITQIGSAPGCALGNCCSPFVGGHGVPGVAGPEFVGGTGESAPLGGQGRASCFPPITLGSVVDIPICTIAAFVHNAVGSGF